MTTHKDDDKAHDKGGHGHPQAPEGHKPPDPAQHEQHEAGPESKPADAPKPAHQVGSDPPKSDDAA